MGFYIETNTLKGKANIIAQKYKGNIVTQAVAAAAMSEPDKGVIVVVDNGPFEAAAFAFSKGEFDAFTDKSDMRHKQFVVGPRKELAEAAKYPRKEEE